MKVAYLTNLTSAVGGGGTNADRLCRAFHQSDEIDVVAVHAQGTNAPETFYTDKLGYPAQFPVSLRDALDEIECDIVFVHAFNVEMIEWFSHYAANDDERVYVWRNGVNTLEQWLNLKRNGDIRNVTTPISNLDFFDGIFAPSSAAAERLKLNYGDDCPFLAIAPCTIDYSEYIPTPFYEDGTLRITVASRIAANNYVLQPLLAVRRLVEQEGFDVEMEILGGADGRYGDTITSVAEGVHEVSVKGHLPPDEAKKYLEWSDVVCIPSISHQAVPTVAVEAMAAGNVVLCSPFHTVNEEDTLIRVPMDHPPMWHDALLDVADDRAGSLDLVNQGIERAKAYDVGRVVGEAYLPMLTMLKAHKLD